MGQFWFRRLAAHGGALTPRELACAPR